MRKQRIVLLAACVAALLGAVGIAAAASGGGESTVEPGVPASAVLSPSEAVHPNLLAHIAALRDLPPAGDALPDAVQSMIASELTPRSGVSWTLARAVETSAGPVYIVPGRDQLCQISQAGAGCGQATKFGQDPRAFTLMGFSIDANTPGTVTVAGIVPDSVQRIEVQVSDGELQEIAVRHNAYGAEVPDSYKALVFHTDDGQKVVAPSRGLPDPSTPVSR